MDCGGGGGGVVGRIRLKVGFQLLEITSPIASWIQWFMQVYMYAGVRLINMDPTCLG